ncbi:hypothetical protein [Bacillus atrophaeus]|uniref:hypothetical protein n=1 Tax=Bacillus atrophaeus TaxID=1452 RepID=UPI00227F3249|nr:hypothetical protein [Bacillus atrophaeus]MCY9204639.1 hypothetical protein [Bacillus atrophaeus]MEC0885849.1 hypothetical protein [Bacillus atrophaeus]MEC0934020.1 hypothetical protein [Bacillus atrophaeus]
MDTSKGAADSNWMIRKNRGCRGSMRKRKTSSESWFTIIFAVKGAFYSRDFLS